MVSLICEKLSFVRNQDFFYLLLKTGRLMPLESFLL